MSHKNSPSEEGKCNRSSLIGSESGFHKKEENQNFDDVENLQDHIGKCQIVGTTTGKTTAIKQEPSSTKDQQLTTQDENLTNKPFRIRTSHRRHLDFDPKFDLNDINAKERSKWSGPFHFVQAADSQFGMIDSYKYRRTEPGWQEEMKLCEELLETCSQMKPKPKFLIICGDLVDAWPSTELRRRQIVDFKRIFSKFDPEIPLVCVCGNHDVGDKPTLDSISEYNKDFGDDYFYFTQNDCLFIIINSQFYQNREFVENLANEQDKWLDELLSKCKLFKYSFIFEHIPWFLEDPLEEDDYFNIRLAVRGKWLKKFYDSGITKILCGHYHRNAGGWFHEMEQIVTSAIGAQMGKDQSGARIVRVMESKVEHQYYSMQDLPQQIDFS